jgi:hypothetical protein
MPQQRSSVLSAWSPSQQNPVTSPADDDFGDFECATEDAPAVELQSHEPSFCDDNDEDLAAAIALSLQRSHDESVVLDSSKTPLPDVTCERPSQTQLCVPPLDLFSFENLDAPQSHDTASTASTATSLAAADSCPAAAAAAAASASHEADLVGIENMRSVASGQMEQQQQQQQQHWLDPSLMLTLFSDDEASRTGLNNEVSGSDFEKKRETSVHCDGGVATACADAGGGGNCSDEGQSSDSEWGEFASFEDATPSKRGTCTTCSMSSAAPSRALLLSDASMSRM